MRTKSIVAILGVGMLALSSCVASAGYGYGPRHYPPRPYYGYGPRTEVIVAPGYGGHRHHHDRWR